MMTCLLQDDAYALVADFLTPGANLNAGQLNGMCV